MERYMSLELTSVSGYPPGLVGEGGGGARHGGRHLVGGVQWVLDKIDR